MFSETLVLDYIATILISVFASSIIYSFYSDYFKRGNKMTDDQLMTRFLFLEKHNKKMLPKKG